MTCVSVLSAQKDKSHVERVTGPGKLGVQITNQNQVALMKATLCANPDIVERVDLHEVGSDRVRW